MASTALQLVGFVLGVLSWIGMIVTCASPEWRQTSHGKTLIDDTIRYDGLWAQCRAFSTGQTHCSVYSKFFIGLPGVLQVCRALMITSITLGFIAVVVTILGIKCTSIGNTNPRAKARAAMIGGLLFLVSAVLVGASVSYYAHGVVQEYYNPVVIKNTPMYLRFEYGSALFVGWASLVVGILGGVILIFTSIFVIMRLNVAERRGRLLPGARVRSNNHQHHGPQQRQQHLPMAQQQKNQHTRPGVRIQADGILTKQRIAQHNIKAGPKNGHSHHTQPTAAVRKPTNRPTSLQSSKSSNDRRSYSGENSQRLQSADRPDGSGKHVHHHHHHHLHGSKSENILKTKSRDDETPPKAHDDSNVMRETNGSHTRIRPAKEYV
ncbi:uncharacterized protein LOC120327612 isoform X1 [Styela clava]|uniref:claudin-10-like isoform X1 n=1 Tax=Styela clava TaxID=7725 RepID=UPI00193970A8|nr:claudin-10-like isoform X1 [Styela clava]